MGWGFPKKSRQNKAPHNKHTAKTPQKHSKNTAKTQQNQRTTTPHANRKQRKNTTFRAPPKKNAKSKSSYKKILRTLGQSPHIRFHLIYTNLLSKRTPMFLIC